MRRLFALSLVLVVVLASCGGGGGSSDAPQHVDAHPLADAPDRPDGGLGPDGEIGPDADLTADASTSPDAAPPPDGAIGSITIHVARATVPQADVLVIVQSDATAASAMELQTDATGTLTTTITGGSYVSLINPGPVDPFDHPTYDRVLTFSGVEPGEELDIDYGGAPTPAQPSFTVTGTSIAPPSGAEVGTLCGGGHSIFGPTVTVSPTRHCEPTMPLVYIGVVGTVSGDFAVGSIYLDAAPSDGTSINVAATPFTASITRLFSLTHANGATAQLYAGTALLGVDHAGGQGTLTDTQSWQLDVAGAVPARYQVAVIRFSDPGDAERDVYHWGSTGNLVFDAATIPAEMSALAFDPATRTVSWTTGAGPTPDAMRSRIVSSGGSVVWDIVGPPPASGALALPHLPSPHDHAVPDASELTLSGYSATGGLPQLRNYVGHNFDPITLVTHDAAGEMRWRRIGDMTFP